MLVYVRCTVRACQERSLCRCLYVSGTLFSSSREVRVSSPRVTCLWWPNPALEPVWHTAFLGLSSNGPMRLLVLTPRSNPRNVFRSGHTQVLLRPKLGLWCMAQACMQLSRVETASPFIYCTPSSSDIIKHALHGRWQAVRWLWHERICRV